jgi:predicted Fe-Mo cluster-binding NifX family protein
MKIAVSSTGPTMESTVEARFGRCPYFLIINPVTMEFEAVSNTKTDQSGGAGIQAAQLLAGKKASAVLTGRCGPNALKALEKESIRVVTGVAGSVMQVVQQFADGSIKTVPVTHTTGRF